MSGATSARWAKFDTIRYMQFPLQAGVNAVQGTMCAADPVNGWVTPATSGNANLINIGQFDESINNASGTTATRINVCLEKEIKVSWYANATGSAAVTALFSSCYMLDNQTVQATAGSNGTAGRVWGIRSDKGIAVQATGL